MAPKTAHKVKKAMSKPPAEATRSHDAYPGEHLGSEATSSRKRASDLFEGDEAGPEAKPTDSIPTKAKKTKTTTANEHVKPSKVDGHPVKTEKTQPGGDMVEVEPRKRGRPSKKKESKAGQDTLAESGGPFKERKSKQVKGADAETESAGHEMPDAGGDDDTGAGNTAPVKSKKDKRGALKEKAPVESMKPKAKATKIPQSDAKPKNLKGKAVEDEQTRKPTTKSAKSKKAPKDGNVHGDRGDTRPADKPASTVPSKKNKKAKASAKQNVSEEKDVAIAPDMAMDESVFDSLLSTDKGKQPVDETPVSSEKPVSGKARKKATIAQTKDQASSKNGTKAPEEVEDGARGPGDRETAASKSKKRKPPPIDDVDAVKIDVLDPLSEVTSAKKKQKKSGSGALEAVGDSVGSLMSSVKKNAKAAIEFAGNVAGGGQTSIMDDVQRVADGAVEDNKKRRNSFKESKDGTPSEESLLKGMESSGDEKDPNEDEGFDQGQSPPPLPKSTFDKINAISHPSTNSKSEGGVVYVGRIPHGFYEHEMRAYFGQFGNINRLRLSRNKTTGASRHYAFIEFDSEEVSKIVAETMNNYLLFGHILKVKAVDPVSLHPNIWKGANKRFKKVPWAQIEGRKLAQPMSREQWEKRVEGEQERRKDKAEKMKKIGYEFDAPLKTVDQVPVRESRKVIGEGGEGTMIEAEKTLVTGPGEEGSSMMIQESTVTKKIRKPSAKAKEIENSKEAAATAGKKGKRKAEEILEKSKETTNITSEPVKKKAMKSKAKADEAMNQTKDTVEDAAAPTVDKDKQTGEKATKKAKEALEEATPVAKKAKKTTGDAVAPAVKKSKKVAHEVSDRTKDSVAPVAKKGKEAAVKASEAAVKASEATATAAGTSEKSKKARA